MNGSSWYEVAALAVTAAGSIIALLKDKREKRGKRWHRNVLLGLTVIGFVVGVGLIHRRDSDNKVNDARRALERSADKQQIASLTQAVQSEKENNQTQYERNQEQLQLLQKQLNGLQTEVATEQLRQKITSLQSQLDKALAPLPQAQIETSFWESPNQDDVVKQIYAPVDANIVGFSLAMVNHSGVNAKSGGLWLRLCDGCKFHNDPIGFVHIDGAPENERLFRFNDLPTGSRSEKMTIEVEVPPGNYGSMTILTQYRCDNCEIREKWDQMLISMGRISPKFSLPTLQTTKTQPPHMPPMSRPQQTFRLSPNLMRN